MNRKLQLKVDIKFGGFLKIRHFLTAIISEIKAIKKCGFSEIIFLAAVVNTARRHNN